MKINKAGFVAGAFAVAAVCATCVFAQDDLDNLLSDLEGKPAAKAEVKEVKKPAPAATDAAKVEPKVEEPKEEKAEAKTEKKEEKAEAKAEEKSDAKEEKAEEKKEEKSEAKAEEKVDEKEEKTEEKKEEKSEAKAEEKADEKEEKAEEKKEEKPEAKVEEKAETKAEEKSDAKEEKTEEEKKEEKPEAKAEEKEEKAEEKKDDEKPAAKEEVKAVAPAAPLAGDAALIQDLAATEALRRSALDRQAAAELEAARAAMSEGDFEEAFNQYRLALAHLNDRPASKGLRRECKEGMAEAKFASGKRALKEGDREAALAFAKEAQKLRHPRADVLIEALEAEPDDVVDKDVSAIKHRRNDADYKESRSTIRKRLRLSAQYLAVSDLDKALEECELVIKYDPYNREAIALRDRIQRRRQVIIDKERAATRRGMIADVGAAWRPVYAVNSSELKDVDGGTSKTPIGGDPELSVAQSIEQRMKEMVLPTITFKPPATIIDAVDHFRQASRDYDRPEIPVEQRGFNFVLKLDKQLTSSGGEAKAAEDDNSFAAGADDAEGSAANASGVPQIPNISASNLSMWDALKLVCDVSGFKFKIERSVVMVMPKDMTTDELVTRSYNVVDSFADRMSSAATDAKDAKGAFDSGKKGDDEGAEEDQEVAWKRFFSMMGVTWPKDSRIMYIRTIGKLRVTNTLDQLSLLELALQELNVTPMMIEVETRFVEVAQEDLNSLGFEWLLNSDYSLNVGGKLGKVLGLKNGEFPTKGEVYENVGDWSKTVTGSMTGTGSRTGSSTTTSTSTSSGYAQSGSRQVTDVSTQTDSTSGLTSDLTGTRQMDVSKSYSKVASNAGNAWRQGSGNDRNVGVSAVDGTTYSSGMRYLSNSDNILKADKTNYSDQFMKVNAFLGNADVSMILHMLSQRSDTDLLSAPKVVTKSGEQANIKVVTTYLYPQDYDVTIQSTSSGSSSSSSTSSSSGGSDGKILPMVEPQNFKEQEVGVILEVTPEVTAEGQMINLTLNPRIISEPTWKDYGMKVPMSAVMSSQESMVRAMTSGDIEWFTVPMEQPFFKTRSIETKISLYNGATVVMGGLITEDRKSQEDKIPFLGDLPFVGRFFRSRQEWSDKRNLLLFVTARLVDPRGHQMTMGQGDAAQQSDAAAAPVTPAPAVK